MKFTAIAVVLGVASAPAFAGPTKMTDAQLDNVTGGALVNAVIIDAVDVNQNDVSVQVQAPVNAAVGVAVLSGPQLVGAQQLGNLTQRK